MTREEGIKQIDKAKWENDAQQCLDMLVQTSDNLWVHAWLTMRPPYCDRGHIVLNIDGPLALDTADSFPRYFFSFPEADAHTRAFLKWRLWKERTVPDAAIRSAFGAKVARHSDWTGDNFRMPGV
jgi:hypothetical protein